MAEFSSIRVGTTYVGFSSYIVPNDSYGSLLAFHDGWVIHMQQDGWCGYEPNTWCSVGCSCYEPKTGPLCNYKNPRKIVHAINKNSTKKNSPQTWILLNKQPTSNPQAPWIHPNQQKGFSWTNSPRNRFWMGKETAQSMTGIRLGLTQIFTESG